MIPLILGLISGESFIQLILTLIVVGLVFAILWWLLAFLKVPEPFNLVIRVLLAVAAAVFLINALLSLIGSSPFRF